MSDADLKARVERLTADMLAASRRTDFIEAAQIRDELLIVKGILEARSEMPAENIEDTDK